MKKGIIIIVVLALFGVLALGYSKYKNKSAEPPTIQSGNAPKIKYSENPKVIGKELVGLLSIPDIYKPEDVIIDIDTLAEPYLEKEKSRPSRSSQIKELMDPDDRFRVLGYGIYSQNNNVFVEFPYNWDVAISSEIFTKKERDSLVYKFKGKGVEGFIDKNLYMMIINDKYHISYSSRSLNPRYEGGTDPNDFPGKTRPSLELIIVGATFSIK